MGVIERIGAMAGTEMAKAVNLAHQTFQDRVGEHGHTGRALVETLTSVCRNHPNAVGIGVGLLVEQLLVHEKHLYEAKEHAGHAPGVHDHAVAPHPARSDAHPALVNIKISKIKPGKVAFEVFGALVALKVASGFAHVFGRKSHKEAWFSPAARIHAISGSIAAYNLAAAIKSKTISSWRNAAILFFGTHAIKPLLKPDRAHRAAVAAARTAPPRPLAPPPPSHPAPGAVPSPAPEASPALLVEQATTPPPEPSIH